MMMTIKMVSLSAIVLAYGFHYLAISLAEAGVTS
jgi:hypothetical protein